MAVELEKVAFMVHYAAAGNGYEKALPELHSICKAIVGGSAIVYMDKQIVKRISRIPNTHGWILYFEYGESVDIDPALLGRYCRAVTPLELLALEAE